MQISQFGASGPRVAIDRRRRRRRPGLCAGDRAGGCEVGGGDEVMPLALRLGQL